MIGFRQLLLLRMRVLSACAFFLDNRYRTFVSRCTGLLVCNLAIHEAMAKLDVRWNVAL